MVNNFLFSPSNWNYQVGGNLSVDAPTYVKRLADIELYNKALAGEFCYVLNSRQMGKSSLRVQVMHQLQANNVACAVVDLTTIGIEQVTVEQWYASLIALLVNSFSLNLNLSAWWRDRTLLSPVQRWSEFIEQILLVEISSSIVIFGLLPYTQNVVISFQIPCSVCSKSNFASNSVLVLFLACSSISYVFKNRKVRYLYNKCRFSSLTSLKAPNVVRGKLLARDFAC